jgi:hypothetical protein
MRGSSNVRHARVPIRTLVAAHCVCTDIVSVSSAAVRSATSCARTCSDTFLRSDSAHGGHGVSRMCSDSVTVGTGSVVKIQAISRVCSWRIASITSTATRFAISRVRICVDTFSRSDSARRGAPFLTSRDYISVAEVVGIRRDNLLPAVLQTYTLAPAYVSSFSGGTTRTADGPVAGDMFDVGAALIAGGGLFTVCDNRIKEVCDAQTYLVRIQ